MGGERIKKINELIKEELAKILLREFDFPKDTFVTLTRVETSKDLRVAKVFISSFPEKERKKIVDFLNRKIYFIQRKLNQKLVMKRVPKIIFFEEKKTVEAAKIEELLEKIKKERVEKN